MKGTYLRGCKEGILSEKLKRHPQRSSRNGTRKLPCLHPGQPRLAPTATSSSPAPQEAGDSDLAVLDPLTPGNMTCEPRHSVCAWERTGAGTPWGIQERGLWGLPSSQEQTLVDLLPWPLFPWFLNLKNGRSSRERPVFSESVDTYRRVRCWRRAFCVLGALRVGVVTRVPSPLLKLQNRTPSA